MAFDELMNAVLKLDRASDTNFKSEIAKGAAQVVLDVIDLPLQQFA